MLRHTLLQHANLRLMKRIVRYSLLDQLVRCRFRKIFRNPFEFAILLKLLQNIDLCLRGRNKHFLRDSFQISDIQ